MSATPDELTEEAGRWLRSAAEDLASALQPGSALA